MNAIERRANGQTWGVGWQKSEWMRQLNQHLWKDKTWIERRAWVRIRVLPLYLRGGSGEEIVQTTGLTGEQVQYAVWNLRASGEIQRPTKEEERLARSKATKDNWRKRKGVEYTVDQKNSFAFARMLTETELIKKDLTYWNALNAVYQLHNRQLPQNFADRLRLEVFLVARKACNQGETGPLLKYRELGEQIDPEWLDRSLANEEVFITERLEENTLGYREDRIGFFREDEYGKWRLIVEGAIFDNSRLLLERTRTREKH